jgi:hypothetical protein
MRETTLIGHRAVSFQISHSVEGVPRLIRGLQLILGNRLYVIQTDEPAGREAPEERIALDRQRFFGSFAVRGDSAIK